MMMIMVIMTEMVMVMKMMILSVLNDNKTLLTLLHLYIDSQLNQGH